MNPVPGDPDYDPNLPDAVPPDLGTWSRLASEWSDAARLLNGDLGQLATTLHDLTRDDPQTQVWHRTSVELHHLRGELDRLARLIWDVADLVGQTTAGAEPTLALREARKWRYTP